MDEPSATIPSQPYPPPPRHLQSSFPGFHHHNHSPLASQLDPSLQNLDHDDAFSSHFTGQLDDTDNGQLLHPGNPFGQRNNQPNFQESNTPRFQEIRPNAGAVSQQSSKHAYHGQPGQFGVLMPLSQPLLPQPNALDRIQHEDSMVQVPESMSEKKEGHFSNMKSIPNPPDLDGWRERLFHVNETITMTEDEFQTYFPHVDNIYSHRSTQKYKRKPFISHYWDCRLKGRPPGTPKSDDPNKRKRKRNARERDLCDVKIKVTEYFPSARTFMEHEFGHGTTSTSEVPGVFPPGELLGSGIRTQSQPFDLTDPAGTPEYTPGSNGERYFTIQRVNGNGANGKSDGVAGPHKHTLEDSDRIKKNSILRNLLKEEKEKKKGQKTYPKKATGSALNTVKRHAKEEDIKFYAGCFCPFVQRVWIALEAKNINYQYIEVDPYKKPESLLEINPRGLVPALKHGDWSTHESTVIMEYLEDLDQSEPLLPQGDPKARAHSRLWTDHINRNIIPAFYHFLQEQDSSKQVEKASEFKDELTKLIDAADHDGPFFLGKDLSFVDIQIAPWILRLRRVLKPYRGWPEPEAGSRWARWIEAIENEPDVKATTSTDELYLENYERYAENRPNTSLLAKAVNSGRGLP